MATKYESRGLWDQVCETDKKYTKEVSFGRKFTSINAQSRLMKATELWGPMGSKWGVMGVREPDTAGMIIFRITVWYPNEDAENGRGEVTQFGQARYSEKDDESFKKAWTDGTTKCLSLLGFNADIYLDESDDDKYQDKTKKVDKNGYDQFKKTQKEIFRLAKKLPFKQQATVEEFGASSLTEGQWFDLLEMTKSMISVFTDLDGLSEYQREEIKTYINGQEMANTPKQWAAVGEKVKDKLEIKNAQSNDGGPGNWKDRK